MTDTDCQISGCVARSRATTVLLPTPDGPDSTNNRGGGRSASGGELLTGSGGTELALKCSHLVGTESAHSPTLRNPQPSHDLPARAPCRRRASTQAAR